MLTEALQAIGQAHPLYSIRNDFTMKRPNPIARPSPNPANMPASRTMLSISLGLTSVLSHVKVKVAFQPGDAATLYLMFLPPVAGFLTL